MNIKGEFYESPAFTNEDDELVRVKVEYDWKPIICAKCKHHGHMESNCRMEVVKKWIPKPKPKPAP